MLIMYACVSLNQLKNQWTDFDETWYVYVVPLEATPAFNVLMFYTGVPRVTTTATYVHHTNTNIVH
jgi:hypothetical protein